MSDDHPMTVHEPLRLAIVGWGAISRTVARKLSEAHIDVDVVAVGVRDRVLTREGLPHGAALIDSPGDLAALEPALVIEAAGRESVGPWGRASLGCGADFVVSSVSAFADDALLDELRQLAEASSAHVLIQPGALAGVEALSAARLMGIDEVEHRVVKPPRAWKGTPAEALCELDSLTEPHAFFRSNATEAASQFPKNANVAMTTALAGIGPQRTTITLVADPTASTNSHQLSAHGAFGELDVTISNNPLPDNPKTSALAALSLVRIVLNRTASIGI